MTYGRISDYYYLVLLLVAISDMYPKVSWLCMALLKPGLKINPYATIAVKSIMLAGSHLLS